MVNSNTIIAEHGHCVCVCNFHCLLQLCKSDSVFFFLNFFLTKKNCVVWFVFWLQRFKFEIASQWCGWVRTQLESEGYALYAIRFYILLRNSIYQAERRQVFVMHLYELSVSISFFLLLLFLVISHETLIIFFNEWHFKCNWIEPRQSSVLHLVRLAILDIHLIRKMETSTGTQEVRPTQLKLCLNTTVSYQGNELIVESLQLLGRVKWSPCDARDLVRIWSCVREKKVRD